MSTNVVRFDWRELIENSVPTIARLDGRSGMLGVITLGHPPWQKRTPTAESMEEFLGKLLDLSLRIVSMESANAEGWAMATYFPPSVCAGCGETYERIGMNNVSPGNRAPYDPGAVLACIREEDGAPLYRHLMNILTQAQGEPSVTARRLQVPSSVPFGRRQLLGAAMAFLLATTAVSRAEDWPMMGRDRTRNPVSPEKGAPVDWDFSSGRNIKWRAKLGSMAFGDPVVARGLVWIGTNNSNPRDPRFLGEGAVLMCFRESDGEFLYQFVVPAQPGPLFRVSRLGFNGSPLVEGERMWLTTLAGEVLCLDLPDLLRGGKAPAEVWKVHLPDEYGVIPHYAFMGDARTCSLSTSYRDRLYVITGHGAGPGYSDVPAPLAPSLLCLDRNSGKALWEDASPGGNIVRGQWASPLVVEIDGRGQVIAPQGGHRITSAAGASTSSIHSSPIFANGALYIVNQEMLYAIQAN